MTGAAISVAGSSLKALASEKKICGSFGYDCSWYAGAITPGRNAEKK